MTHSTTSERLVTPTRMLSALFVFALAAAIFCWGLHSKLSLYDAPPEAQATLPLAKLLSEQERPSSEQVERRLNAAPTPHIIVQAVISDLLVQPDRVPRCEREQRSVPTPVAFSFSGPSQLRPPPTYSA